MVFSLKLPYQQIDRLLWLKGVTASEDIYCGVAIFRPCMNGEVGFSNDHHTADPAIWRERVKGVAQYSSTGHRTSGEEGFLQKVAVAYALPIAILEVQNQVLPY